MRRRSFGSFAVGLGPVDMPASAPSSAPSISDARSGLRRDKQAITGSLPFTLALRLTAVTDSSVGDSPPPLAPALIDKVRGSVRRTPLDATTGGGDPAQPGGSDAAVEDAIASAENVVSPLVDPDYTGGFTPNSGTDQTENEKPKWSKYLLWGGIVLGGIFVIRRIL